MRRIATITVLCTGLLFLLAGCGKKETSVAVTGVSVSPASTKILVGESTMLTATVKPEKASNKDLSWKTSNDAVATVNGGLVEGVGEGVATITVTTVEGGFTAQALVNVSQIHASGVELVPSADQVLLVGDAVELTAKVSPANAVDLAVVWSSSDAGTVSVTPGLSEGTVSKAVVKALKGGSATITVTTRDQGHSASLKISVPGTSANPGGSFGEDNYGQYN
ncbi:MAG: Ig-like domain-containing protein [Bacteroidales bacterium]|nr:Ig-like domain-containing protein [Bacteroidales bacterium]